MKEISQQDGNAAVVASSETCQIPSLRSYPTADDGQGFDDDDNEGWELGVGDLIIDLDADLERNNTSPISDPSPPASKMSAFEHQATVVDKGLKMKIKRKSGGKSSDTNKHEIVKNDSKLQLANISETSATGNNAEMPSNSKTKASPNDGKEKPVKGRGAHKKDKNAKDKAKLLSSAAGSASDISTLANGFPNNHGSNNSNNADSTSNSMHVDNDSHKLITGIKREVMSDDPYEFNAKVEDRISMPLKKIKVEKLDNSVVASCSSGSSISAPSVDASTATSHVGTITEPECLGACEPGTSVCLEGIVWQETENGVLVVNVTWRGKTYVGTLLDATKHDWAPPRFSCDSPTSDIDARTPKRGGKRTARGSVSSTPVTETSLETRKLRKGRRGGNGTVAPPSPAKSDVSSGGMKRKGRPADLDINLEDIKSAKRYRSNSRGTPTGMSSLATSESSEPALIECPEPNCNKKYRHINGLRYHQSHAHSANSSNTSEDKDKENSSEDSRPSTPTDSVSSDNKPTGRRTPKSKDSVDKSKGNQTKMDISDSKTSKDTSSNSKSAKDSEKSDSSATAAAKSANDTVTAGCINPVASTPVTSSQVYQISGTNVTRIGNLTVVQKPMDATTHLIGQTTTTTITAVTVPITTVAALPAQIVGEKDEKKKKGENKGKSNKSVGQRPIVPATAMPQVITLTTNGPLTHSSMAAPQISPTSNLKPIQPKPSSMTEPSTVNPVLAGLQKEKKPKKKKKDKVDRDAHKSSDNRDAKSSDNNKDDHTAVKCEQKSVIKPNPSLSNKTVEGDNRSKSVLKQQKTDSTKTPSSGGDTQQQQSRGNVPPASLNLSSPLAGSEAAEPGSENVQSPAYSDISDANESAPQLDSENEGKPSKENAKSTQPEGMNTPERTSDTSMKPYGMYSYYGQPPYLIPAVSKNQSMTPNQSNPPATPPSASGGSDLSKSGKPMDSNQPIDATDNSSGNTDKSATSNVAKDDNGLIKNIKKEVVSNYPESQDYQPQQKVQQPPPQQQPQMFGRGIQHPQFGFMGAYGYAMDPAYHMHLMATDPHYKQQHELYIEEQERLRKEQVGGKASPSSRECKTPNKPVSGAEPIKLDERMSRTASPKSMVDQNKNDPKLSDSKVGGEKDSDQPMNLKAGASDLSKKQPPKETIRIKTEPKDTLDPNVVQQEKIREKHQEELQRYYMYQQQKLMEQHRVEDIRKRSHGDQDRQKSEHMRSDHKQSREQHADGQKSDKSSHKDSSRPSKVPTPHDGMKRDSIDHGRDGSGSRDGSVKHRDDVNKMPHHRMDDKRGSPAMTNKPKEMQHVGHGANMVQGAYPGYMGHPYPHYAAQLHYNPDPNHPMYRGLAPMMGYPGHPYMHPAQIRYMSPVDHPDKDKIPPIPSAAGHPVGQPPPGVIGSEQPKALDLLQQHASYYASQQHKIHELEKVKPDSRMSPKMAEGSPMSNKSKSEYTNSPPPQRHLHTHHHTHLMGGYPPGAIYDPYGAILASQQAAAAAAAGIPPHPYAGK